MAEELTVIELLLGISLGVIAAAFFSLGAVFQKKGVMEIPEIQLSDVQSMKEMVKSKIWIIGLVLGILGGPMYMLSQAYIGVTLAQPLMGTGMIFTVIASIKLFIARTKSPLLQRKFPRPQVGNFGYRRMSEFFTLWLSPSKISRWLWCTRRSIRAVVMV